jgi:prepilin-type N-terminal cleavage/methylation domain-containing protein
MVRFTHPTVGETAMNTQCPKRNQRSEDARGTRSSSFVRHSAFTLIELLVTITIICILAGMSLSVMRYARTAAAEGKTKATIAKLNALVMQRYESYMTRRVPIDTTGMAPRKAALLRYCALLDLMRMEMPERTYDILNEPLGLNVPANHWTIRPALSQMYLQKYNNSNPGPDYRAAKYLYMWVSMTNPEALSQFGQNEIADIDNDGWPVFIDGWGNPIMFLRWAPGFLPFNNCDTEVQTGDPINDHDPFDSRRISPGNYRLIPLIYSGGPDQAGHEKKYGIRATAQVGGVEEKAYYGVDPATDTLDILNPYATVAGGVLIGSPDPAAPSDRLDNIHNHRIEQQ